MLLLRLSWATASSDPIGDLTVTIFYSSHWELKKYGIHRRRPMLSMPIMLQLDAKLRKLCDERGDAMRNAADCFNSFFESTKKGKHHQGPLTSISQSSVSHLL